ncbi:DegT/DnrJ/EryC1/StrS family aminotransferase [Fulvivirga lutimaris]|uniref:DegT/DnrJ/EryC1/StrS family aminotransferase n=1 Tax=Fulvivirga lutimaris TaxID=1819566 RepID=UPI0012BC4553|nr:DegT/DnrJ/EryC1/StrS family aminotransferase [Fulvivirga lutimaris]
MSTNKTIPFCNPGLRFDHFKNELNDAFQKVASSNSYILGSEVAQFETALSKYISTEYCIGVNSATDGLALSLMALGVKSGDEVVTAGLTAPATVTSILQIGAKPVVVDILDTTHCINPAEIKKAITKKTKAIVPVHLHGYACEMDQIMAIAFEHNLYVIEDCSQAHGASFNNQKLGSIGDCGVFSFYPTKNLGCMGDGGAITTNNGALASKLRALRNYGLQDNNVAEAGINSRLDEVHAAILNTLLPALDEHNESRRKYANLYQDALKNLPLKLPPIDSNAIYHQFPVRMENRNEFRNQLKKEGVLTGIHYDKSINQHDALKQYCQPLPVATRAAEELVSLPIQPEILDTHFETIVTKIKLALQ